MDRLTPIPSAPGARWRRWRAPLCQLLVFLVTCVLISLTWRQMQRPGSFPGQVEVVETLVSSGDAGFITNLWVHPLQEIKAGDLVAEVITTDPRTVNNRLEAKMHEAFTAVLKTSLKYTVDMRTAAYIEAINRVATVTRMRGMYA